METIATDRISQLPDEILHHILSFLSMNDAVRTSILSNRWRDLWTFNPTVQFPPFTCCSLNQEQYFSSIDRCLDIYKAEKLHKFLLRFCISGDIGDFFPKVEKWIRFATTREVQKLIVKIFIDDIGFFELPCSLFSCQSLRKLVLASCNFNPPLSFSGFNSLKTLSLSKVKLTDETVHRLLSTCPLLESLTITVCRGLKNVKISAPNLQLKTLGFHCEVNRLEIDAPNLISLVYAEDLSKLCLKNVPCLLKADLSGDSSRQVLFHWRTYMANITGVKNLIVNSWFLQFIFAEYYKYGSPHIVFQNLKEFHWTGALTSRSELLALVTFFGDCPSLEEVSINVQNKFWEKREQFSSVFLDDGLGPFLELEGGINFGNGMQHFPHLDYRLYSLKKVEVDAFSGDENEMELVKFLLQRAVVLDTLLLTLTTQRKWWSDAENVISKELLCEQVSLLPKASFHAQVVLVDPPFGDLDYPF